MRAKAETAETTSSWGSFQEFCSELRPEQRVWFLSEYRLRQTEVASQIVEHSPAWRALTVGDAFYLLLRDVVASDDRGTRGSAQRARGETPRATILTERDAELFLANRFSLTLNRAAVWLRFLDRVRLLESTPSLLKEAIDQFGNVRDFDVERSIEILDVFENFQRDEHRYDATGVAAALLEYAELEPYRGILRALLPDVIVLDQLTQFFPLTDRLWSALSQLTTVIPLVLKPPAFEDAAIRLQIAQAVTDPQPQVVEDLCCQSLHVWMTEERSDEIQLVAATIADAIRKGSVLPSEVRIVCPALDVALPSLRREFQRFDLPILCPRGESLSHSSVAQMYLAYLEWRQEPVLERFFDAFRSHLLDLPSGLDIGLLDEVSDVAAKLNLQQRLIGNSADFHALAEQLVIAHALRWRRGLDDEEELENERRRQRFADALEKIHLLYASHVWAATENDFAWKKFFQLRKTSRCCAWPTKELRRDYVRATRALQQIARNMTFGAGLLNQLGVSFVEMTRREIGRVALTEEIDLSKIIVTELLDIRAVDHRCVVLMGATNEAFEGFLKRAEPQGGFDELTTRLHYAFSREAAAHELGRIQRRLLQWSTELVVTLPQNDVQGEITPSRFAVELSRHSRSSAGSSNRFSPTFGAESSGFTNSRTMTLLAARKQHEFTDYDGLVGKEFASLAARIHKNDFRIRYAVTALELLADCPHRFFFRYGLGLEELSATVQSDLSRELGVVIHRALELFYADDFYGKRQLTRVDAAKSLMRAAAEQALIESKLDWDSLIILRAARARLIRGLSGEIAPGFGKGTLLRALEYLAELYPSPPIATELRIGAGRTAPLKVSDQIEISGTIDRLQQENGKTIVVDYKTGRAVPAKRELLSSRSLQLPLYAAYVAQCLLQGETPDSGVLLYLSRESSIEELGKRVAIEGLALTEAGKMTGRDAVAARIDCAFGVVQVLDRLVRDGSMHQVLDTKGCPTCHFRSICGRDEEILKLKTSADDEFERNLEIRPRVRRLIPIRVRGSSRAMQLSSEQEAASVIERSVILSAGAGSGKTGVLRTRLMRLLLAGQSPYSILAITFTEKAAAEIRERLGQSLYEAIATKVFDGQTLTDTQLQNLSLALRTLPFIQLSTIHSFALRIIRALNLKGISDGDVNILSGAEHRLFIQEAVASVLDEREESPVAVALARVLESGIELHALSRELARLVSLPRFRLNEILRTANRLRTSSALDALLHQVERSFQQARMACLEACRTTIKGWQESFISWLSAFGDLNDEQRTAYHQVDQLVQRFIAQTDESAGEQSLRELSAFLESQSKLAKRKSPKNPRNFWLELRDLLREKLPQLQPFQAARERFAIQLSADVLFLVQQVFDYYQQRKARIKRVDFDDLIQIAHDELFVSAEAEQAQSWLLSQFQHVLVDEFQDTDPLQWKILSLFAADRNPRRTFFVVGDEKQSIYGFRGGDSRVFDLAARDLAESAERLSLLDNYRSSAEVVEFVNQLFRPVFELDSAFEGDDSSAPKTATAIRFEDMRFQRTLCGTPARVMLHFGESLQESADGMSKISRKDSEADTIARFLRERLNVSSEHAAQSIAILCRTRSELNRVAAALRAHGVQFSIAHTDGFYDLPEILPWETLLRVLAREDDEIALVGLLRSPIIGLSDRELLQIGAALGFQWQKFSERADSSAEPLPKEISEKIRRWRLSADQIGVAETFRLVAEEQKIFAAYEQIGEAEAAQNILRLFEFLAAHERDGGSGTSPRAVARWFAAQRSVAGGAPRGNAPDSPVLLSTIHGTKGLEFSTVILPFLSDTGRTESDFLIGDNPFDEGALLGIRVSNEEEFDRRSDTYVLSRMAEQNERLRAAEERRVFYVACTRARDELILSIREGASKAEISRSDAARSSRPAAWFHWVQAREGTHLPIEAITVSKGYEDQDRSQSTAEGD